MAEIASRGIEPVVADVLKPDSMRGLPAAERIFYCVGFDRSAGMPMRTVYVDGLQNVLDALPRTVARFVYASSTGVYGQVDGEWVDEDSPTCPHHESGKVCLEAEERIRVGPKRMSVRRRPSSCGSRVSMDQAESCVARWWSAGSRSPAIRTSF